MNSGLVRRAILTLGTLVLLNGPAFAQQQATTGQGSPVQVAEAIVAACRANDIEAVERFMHPVMRYRWAELGLAPQQLCDGIIKGGRLRSVTAEVEPSLREGDYVPVLLKYTYDDGTETADRMVFFRDKGSWKLVA